MAALIADGACEPWRISMAPPPGLPASAAHSPAKVVPIKDALQVPGPVPTRGSAQWVNTVVEAIPYLNAQQLYQALGILDRAIMNTQQAKALEMIAMGAYQVAPEFPGLSQVSLAAESLTAQVCEQQQALLDELTQLRTTAASAGSATTPLCVTVPPGLDGLLLPKGAAPTSRLPEAAAPREAQAQVRAEPWPAAAAPAAARAAQQWEEWTARAADAPRGAAGGRQVQTLSTSLQLLSTEDPDCLFIVRRINKLGFKAARKLKQHYSAFGAVVRVLVAHSTVRGDPRVAGPARARRRPSSLGFVQMTSPEAVAKVLEQGAEQEVDGSFIRVQRFERQHSEEAMAEEEASDEKAGGVQDFKESELDEVLLTRQQSAATTSSTRASTEFEETLSRCG